MPATKSRKQSRKSLSPLRRPDEMTLADWQIGLRRQAAETQEFRIKKTDDVELFGEYSVAGAGGGRAYRVVIRGEGCGVNFCSCPDYSVNTLGTCKHIESVLGKLRKRRGSILSGGFSPSYAEVYLRYGERRQLAFAAGKDAPNALTRLASSYFDKNGEIQHGQLYRLDGFIQSASSMDCDLRVYEDARAFIARARDDESRRALLDKLFRRGVASAWRGLLKAELLPYQREGVLFAARAGRAIIADDMGLGKTIQAIGVAEMLARHCGVERVLVICPSSLKYQWEQEIKRFTDRIPCVIEGLLTERRRRYAAESFFKIVNYDVVHHDLAAISAWRPDLVILDEAQRIKNWKTRAARTVKSIESTHALVLTGTPLENRLDELHSITEFVDRFRLGPLFAFKSAHEIVESGTTKVIGYKNLGKVQATLAPILIRRTKAAVLTQLPGRTDKNFFVPMTTQQWEHHDENRDIVAKLVAKWKRFGFLTESEQLKLQIALQIMRMSCDSTYLVDHETDHGNKVAELERVLEDVLEDNEIKVVIFSQWLRMNELVADMLESRKWGHVALHGGVASKDRPELMRALKEDPDCRVFLSTDAGGTGLNLQRASCIINMDLPWNPAVLEQRIARVHRMGQQRAVRVVNFVAEGAIEHGMLSLLSFKRSMFAGVLDGGDDTVMMGGSALQRFMKTVQSATASVPATHGEPVSSSGGDEPSPRETHDSDDAVVAAEKSAGLSGSGSFNASGSADLAAAISSLDRRALGGLVEQAGRWLNELGRALLKPASNGGHRPQPGSGRASSNKTEAPAISVEIDPGTGQHDLRIRLPDEKRIGDVLSALSRAIGTD